MANIRLNGIFSRAVSQGAGRMQGCAPRRNITAYSWPSHCARYLHTIEDQKATSQSEGTIR
eukprot:1156894-Pelagomonas_calceolata.AAC.9